MVTEHIPSVSITTKANVFFDGKCISHTVLTATGEKVQGWVGENGNVDTNGPIGDITIPVGTLRPATATQSISFDMNLNAAASAGPPADNFAGSIEDAHRASLGLLDRQFALPVTGQADVVVYGLPNNDYYSRYSVLNPILLRNLALSYAAGSYQGMPLARQGGIAIFINPCRRQFSAQNHPSYIEL